MSRPRPVALSALALLPLLAAAPPGRAQSTSSTGQSVFGASLGRTANSALAVMGYATVPDGTASDLSISQGQDSTGLLMGQLGTGFTVSESVPLYLEGYIGYSRYDPLFVATLGAESTRLPIRWNSVSTTIGIGWSFPVTDRMQIRPILNGSIGYLGSDLAIAGNVLQYLTGVDINLLDRGQLVAAGLGGAMVLAWYDYRPEWEFEAELRYSRMQLQSVPGTTDGLTYRAENGAIGLWTRYRWPTGREAYGRPVRYVLEGLHSQFLYDQRGALGFNSLTKVGGGLELDMGRQEIGAMGLYLQRVRLMGRVVFGQDVTGYSIGLGMSF
jgi:hypothetical protein